MTDELTALADKCRICGLPVTALSYGGPDVCPSCDCGDFGYAKVARQGQKIAELEAKVADMEKIITGIDGRLHPGWCLELYEGLCNDQ